MPRPYTKKPKFEESAEVVQARRSKLRELIEERGGVGKFADANEIDRVHLEKLTTENDAPVNRRDLLSLRVETIRKILDGLQLSDRTVVELLNIPPHLREKWETARAAPLGRSGQVVSHLEIIVPEPLVLTLQPGHLMTIDTANIRSGDILVRLNGRYLIIPADALPEAGEALGQVVSVDTLIRRPVPEP